MLLHSILGERHFCEAVIHAPIRRIGGINAGRILAHPAAIRAHKGIRATILAHALNRLGNCVRGVIVPCAAEEGQPPCQSQPARIIRLQTKVIHLIENGDRETAIKIEIGDIFYRLTRARQSHFDTGDRGRVCGKIGPLGQHQLGRVGDGMDMHPLVLWHTQFARLTRACHDNRRGLVHLIARHGHPRVRLGYNPVSLGHGCQFFSTAVDRRCGVRVGSGNFGEGFEQLANVIAILVQTLAQFRAPRILGDGVKRDRAGCAMREKAHLHHPISAETLILKITADLFRPIGRLTLGG